MAGNEVRLQRIVQMGSSALRVRILLLLLLLLLMGFFFSRLLVEC